MPSGAYRRSVISNPLETFIDEDLLQYRDVWAAAGTPNAVFQLPASDLVKLHRRENCARETG